MSFTVRDYKDLLQLLSEHPEWREELRRVLLNDDFLALPKIVRELAEAQKVSSERLTRLEQTVAKLAEAQRRTEQRVEELAKAQKRNEQQIRELTEVMKRHEERLANVEERLTRVEGRLDKLTERVDGIEIRLAKVDGRTLETEYERKAGGYFGRILRNPQMVNLGAVEKQLLPPLTEEEFGDVWLADLILRGQLRQLPKGRSKGEAWLVVEVSVLVDTEDVERAVRRAESLRKANILAIPVVAGEEVTERALQMAEGRGVVLVKDGSIRFVEQALQRYE